MNLELYPPKEPNRAEYPFTHSTRYKGLDIDIENADGSVRSGVDANGKEWETKFDGAHYGELRGFKGADGDPVDVYLASAPDEEGFDKVFIVHQNFPGNHPEKAGEFDEDKVVLGVRDVDAAKALYLKHYDRADYLRSVTEMPFDQFVASLKSGDAENKIAGVVARASAVENASKATKDAARSASSNSSKKKKSDKAGSSRKPTPFIRSHMREGGAVMLKKAYELGVHAALQEVGLEKKAGDDNAAYPGWASVIPGVGAITGPIAGAITAPDGKGWAGAGGTLLGGIGGALGGGTAGGIGGAGLGALLGLLARKPGAGALVGGILGGGAGTLAGTGLGAAKGYRWAVGD